MSPLPDVGKDVLCFEALSSTLVSPARTQSIVPILHIKRRRPWGLRYPLAWRGPWASIAGQWPEL